jgi:iron complex outermembrane receptor protein
MLLIDGQPQTFNPNASSFFGPALMPMSGIDRIEVVRGPGSALYGADAFLATVNAITTKSYVGANKVTSDVRAYAGSANGVDASISGGVDTPGRGRSLLLSIRYRWN